MLTTMRYVTGKCNKIFILWFNEKIRLDRIVNIFIVLFSKKTKSVIEPTLWKFKTEINIQQILTILV